MVCCCWLLFPVVCCCLVLFVIVVCCNSGQEGQPKEPHVLRGDSGKDPPPVKQKPRSQGIEVRDRWEGDPRESPGKGSWFVVVGCCFLLFVVVWCCLLLLFVVVWVYVCLCGCCWCCCCSCYCSSCCSCCCCWCWCCCCLLFVVVLVVVLVVVVLVVVVAAVAVAISVAVPLAQCCCCCLWGKHACWLLQVLFFHLLPLRAPPCVGHPLFGETRGNIRNIFQFWGLLKQIKIIWGKINRNP